MQCNANIKIIIFGFYSDKHIQDKTICGQTLWTVQIQIQIQIQQIKQIKQIQFVKNKNQKDKQMLCSAPIRPPR